MFVSSIYNYLYYWLYPQAIWTHSITSHYITCRIQLKACSTSLFVAVDSRHVAITLWFGTWPSGYHRPGYEGACFHTLHCTRLQQTHGPYYATNSRRSKIYCKLDVYKVNSWSRNVTNLNKNCSQYNKSVK